MRGAPLAVTSLTLTLAPLALAALIVATPPALASGHGEAPGHAAAPEPVRPPPPPTPAAAAAPDAAQPWRLIRALHRLQARLGEGDVTAQAALGDLVADLAGQFDAAPEAVWDDRRNAAADMVLLLSGADPRAARARLDKGLYGSFADVPRAGLAFADGDAAQARRQLEELVDADLDDLPRAYAALTAASLIAAGPAQSRAEAHALFDRARLLAPGLLPEEAALRRQARLAEEQGDRPRFAALNAAYLRRYPASVYAPPVRARLPRAMAALAVAPQDIDSFEPLLAAFSTPERIDALDRIARQAISAGKAPMASAAARRLLDAAPADAAAGRRARVYALAVQAVAGGPEVVARLAQPQEGGANDPDAEALRRAALDLARQIYAWPPAPPSAASPPGEAPPAEASIRKALADGETLLRAAPALGAQPQRAVAPRRAAPQSSPSPASPSSAPPAAPPPAAPKP